jgi:hypothetical protein
MICPRCGWVMHLLNSREHNEYEDHLYQCQCGTTHLQIASKTRKNSIPLNYNLPEIEERV